ncbi:MAG: winged helix-turn-helix transcriptional regulator, partial [Myxococcales bacterium]|nr:winged helix-turn-helix transcriptional regulator [Myxococcales bacterium]
MGARSNTETPLRLLAALLERRTWTQAELARRVGVQAQTVKRCLEELAADVPLERDEEHPHVYWSVPQSWLPEGVHLPRAHFVELLRRVARSAPFSEHDALLKHLVDAAPSLGGMVTRIRDAHVPTDAPLSSALLAELEDAWDSHAVILSYRKTRGGGVEPRHCSPARFVDRYQHLLARCHQTGKAKRFRLDRVLHVTRAVGVDYQPLSEEEVQDALTGAVDGFRAPGPLVSVRFRLVGDEAEVGWMVEQLPEDLSVEPIASGYLVHGETGALSKLAEKLV